MNSKIVSLLFCIALFISGCETNIEKDNGTNIYNNSDTVILDDDLFLHGLNDAFEIIDAYILNDDLHITIDYAGGCGDFSYNLLAPNAYIEGLPFEKSIKLGFNDNDDCEAGIEVELIFDITPIQKLETNSLIIILDKWDEQLEYNY